MSRLTNHADGIPGPQGPKGDPGADGSSTVAEQTYVVGGGTSGTQPTFTGSPLFYGSYASQGDLVHFRVNVDFDNITRFGTGQ
jgi:hypothetical protein